MIIICRVYLYRSGKGRNDDHYIADGKVYWESFIQKLNNYRGANAELYRAMKGRLIDPSDHAGWDPGDPVACPAISEAVVKGLINRSENDPLDLIERDLIVAPIVELGRARALVRRHLLRVFQQPAVEQIDGDAGRPKRVAAELRDDPGLQARAARSSAARPAAPSAPP